LGHLVGGGCYTPLESKCNVIKEMPLPSTITQLRSFLGSVGYYQKFICHFSDIASHLFSMLKKGSPKTLQWSETAKSAFFQLRNALTQKPILQLPSPNLPFTLQTDASDTGLGAVLLQPSQADPRTLVPVIYASRRLREAERNYSVIEKEALAIYWAVRKFELYLYGQVFELATDHKPLLHLQSADKLNPRLKRWAIYLNLFKFYSKHVPGTQNYLADMLSRSPPETDLSQE
ncbi:MAG: ribonuclease H family protein, partial [Bacteroidota bacterium]